MRRLLVAVIAFMMVAGCSGGESAPRLTGDLVYVRDGGFAGVHDELTIHPDRRARLAVRGNGGREFRLTEEEFGKVARAMDKSDFDNLPAEPARGDAVSDAFSHTIGYQKKRLRAEDPSVPPSLRPLLSELQVVIGAHRPR